MPIISTPNFVTKKNSNYQKYQQKKIKKFKVRHTENKSDYNIKKRKQLPLFSSIFEKNFSRNIILVDPGSHHLGIGFSQIRTLCLFNFKNIIDLTYNVHLTNWLNQISRFDIPDIVCEQQLVNKNTIVEGFVSGLICSQIKINKIYSFPPYLKLKCAQNCGFEYKKIKSNKAYASLPTTFKNEMEQWKIFEIDENSVNEKSFKPESFKKIKKKDDLIDLIIFYLFIVKK